MIRKLSGNDWFWISFVAIISTFATLLGFLMFLPSYALALAACFVLTNLYPGYFRDVPRYIFVLKVIAAAIPIFIVLCLLQIFVFHWPDR